MNKRIVTSALVSTIIALGAGHSASAGPTYQDGKISDLTMAGDQVLIRINTGIPDNCTGTPYGWLLIPSANKPMQAYILGLQLRGDIAEVQMRVYTSGMANGYCNIDQIDPT